MSRLKFKPSLFIAVEEEENKEPLLDIDSIVENYFTLHDSIEYSPRGNLGALYRQIYEALNTEHGRIVFDDQHIELRNMQPISGKMLASKHKPIFYEFTKSFNLPPIHVKLSEDEKFIVKTFTLDGNTPEIKIEQLMLVIREIVMQLYGYYLNSIRQLTSQETDGGHLNLVIIPKIYYVERSGDSIFVCMEYIHPAIKNIKLTFDFDPIIKSVFTWFESHQLYHNDTAPRNIYLTKDNFLAVIDFGEAYIKLTNMPYTHTIESQKTGYLSKQTEKSFRDWLNKVNDDDPFSHRFGGNKSIKRKKLTKKKTKKRRGKKGKKIGTRRKK